MKKITFSSLILLMSASLFAGNPVKSQIAFRENKGQIAGANGKPATQVLFKATGTAPGIYVTTSGITYVFYQNLLGAENKSTGQKTGGYYWSKIEMFLQGANIKTENIKTENALPSVANFYLPHCEQGIENVKSWKKITVADIYPGIDWVLDADDKNGLSYDFIVHPGADPSQIHVLYKGATSIELQEKNSKLVLHSIYGDLYEGNLNVFETGGKKINAAFKLRGNELTYSIGRYSDKYELIIDPPLQWSKKEISSGIDYANSIVVPRDGTGDVLVTGFSGATNFPSLNAYQGSNAGNDDMVILRMNTSGTVLWATYYGGSNFDGGKGIGADVAGNCYVTGYTNSANFPTLNPLYSAFQGGTNDVAILKLNNTGARQWATYYGSLNDDYANAIICDQAGNSYIIGYTNSPNFPVLNAIQPTKNNVYDAFIMKLNSSSVVQWATFFGGDDDDRGRGITLDAGATNVFVTGTTIGQFSVTPGAFQITNASLYNVEDIFVSKLNANTAAMQYSTLCGGTDADIAGGIAVDNSGNAYVTGYTFSNNYPVFNPGSGAFVDSTIGSIGTHDVFVTKFNATGTAAPWSTYMGGAGVDMGFGICYDPFYGIYVTGSTASTDFPVQMPSDNVFYQSVQGDGGNYYDFFITWFTTGGVMKWNTYYGDANSNEGRGIHADAQSNIFVCGADSNNVRVIKFAHGILTGITETNNTGISLHLYPVPAQNNLALEVEMKKAGTVKIEILNAEGALIRKEILPSSNGKNTFTFDISSLPSGNYFLKLEDSQNTGTVKFNKVQ
jgi:hypothetical protein